MPELRLPLDGSFKVAAVARPPSPVDEAVPVPAIVEIKPVAESHFANPVICRSRRKYRLPAESTARPLGFFIQALYARIAITRESDCSRADDDPYDAGRDLQFGECAGVSRLRKYSESPLRNR